MQLKCGVIGVGYLGRFHAQKYRLIPDAELLAVCDINPHVAQQVASELGVTAYNQYQDLLSRVDAVSIVTTTPSHYSIAKTCIEAGIHVLIEKPICETVAQTQELITLAQQHQVKLQVGHIERFNPVYQAVTQHVSNPILIEARRLAPFNPRGASVNVILDMMIHDIDLIYALIKSPIIDITAQGTAIISAQLDVANARLTFANNCVANITASRVNSHIVRHTQIYQPDKFLAVDYHTKTLEIYSPNMDFPVAANYNEPRILELNSSTFSCRQEKFSQSDALQHEIQAFVHAILTNTQPIVSGEDGRVALATAEKINNIIQRTQQYVATA